METTHTNPPAETRKAAVGGLAVVGFIALILIGIATAIYAASFLPKALSRLSSANVYLSGLVQPSGNNQLQTVNPSIPVDQTPAPTTISLSPGTTTTQTGATPTYTPPTTVPPVYTPSPTPTYKPPVYTQPTYHVVTVPASQNYYGLPDLVATITSVGYLRNDGDTNSFVSSDTVPSGRQGAVRFVIANHGTNPSGSWNFEANLPTNDSNSTYHSASQRSLNPGDSIVFTLGFDNADSGRDSIRITADSNDNVNETNENNNDDSASIYFNGTSNSNNNSNSGSYDSNGHYCQYGTYYQNGRYYCDSNSNNNSNGSYDSNGHYCQYGTYTSNGRDYCNNSNNSNNNQCTAGGYYGADGNYYCYGDYYYNRTNTCQNGSYYQNGSYICY